MSEQRRHDPEWKRAARELGDAVGGASRRLARGLKDLTRRPEDDRPEPEEEPADRPITGDNSDRVREAGRELMGTMGRLSVRAGRGIRKAAFDTADTVRGAVEAARARDRDQDQ